MDSIKNSKDIFDFWNLSLCKPVNEWGAVVDLLACLSIDASSLSSTGKNDPPDCTLQISSDFVGIEVVGLVDQKARELSAKARREGATEYYAVWTPETFRKSLTDLVRNKEDKISQGKARSKSAAYCDRFWLLVHTDEFFLYSSEVSKFVGDWRVDSAVFDRVFLLLSYEPGRTDTGYPIFELKHAVNVECLSCAS